MNDLTTEEIEALARALNRIPPEPASFDENSPPIIQDERPEQISATRAQYTQLDRGEEKPQTNEQQQQLQKLPINIEVILGSAQIPIKEALQLHTGSIINLNTLAGEPVELRANGEFFASAEVVVVDEYLGIRILTIYNRGE